MADAILEARGVSKRYPRYGGVFRRKIGDLTAVDQVSCALQPGQTLGLVGESGCGKTTFAKMLVGLLAPSAGEILTHGEPLAGLRGPRFLAARRAVQFVFQDPMNSLNPRMTVEDTLSEPLAIHQMATRVERRKRVEALLATVKLPSAYRSRLPRELSGGERQRVGIARALATEPQALICDEPIAALDVSIGAQILELLRSLVRERRMALLFISHDLRAVASLCADVAVMRDGQIVERGATDAILTRPQHPYTSLLLRSADLDLDAPLDVTS